MTLRNLLAEYSASPDEIAAAEQLLLELSECGLPRNRASSVVIIANLQRLIATCEAQNVCIEMMLDIIPADVLDSPPSAKHMANLTRIAIAKKLLLSAVKSAG